MEQIKMTANDAVRLMLNAINGDDKANFYKVAEQYLSTLSRSGDHYYRLSRLIKDRPAKLMMLDSLSNDVKKLIRVEAQENSFVYTNNELKSIIDDLLFEWDNKEVYKYHSLKVRNKILLHGPTGNGKTTLAKSIAKQINLPFIEVNADNMIDSHIGSTGGNINRLLNSIKEPSVLFWDEVDTIGRSRGNSDKSSAGMENERMVNSMLINIERLDNNIIFIGATNRMEILDSAFLRRFDVLYELKNPNNSDKEFFSIGLFNFHNIPFDNRFSNEEFLNGFLNFSSLKDEIMNIARKHVIRFLSEKKLASAG